MEHYFRFQIKTTIIIHFLKFKNSIKIENYILLWLSAPHKEVVLELFLVWSVVEGLEAEVPFVYFNRGFISIYTIFMYEINLFFINEIKLILF